MNQHNVYIRQCLMEEADKLLSQYPQYKDYHVSFFLVRAKVNCLWKSGAMMSKGDITIGRYERDVLDYSGRWLVCVFHYGVYGWTVTHCIADTHIFEEVR